MSLQKSPLTGAWELPPIRHDMPRGAPREEGAGAPERTGQQPQFMQTPVPLQHPLPSCPSEWPAGAFVDSSRSQQASWPEMVAASAGRPLTRSASARGRASCSRRRIFRVF